MAKPSADEPSAGKTGEGKTNTRYAARRPQFLGRVRDRRVPEISGVIAARVPGGGWWVLNDGGHSATLLHLGLDGLVHHQLVVSGVRNVDWEDLSAFEWSGRRYLVIGDTGDNDRRRRAVNLIVVPEPRLEDWRITESAGESAGVSVTKSVTESVTENKSTELEKRVVLAEWVRRIRLIFPDGPHDVESLAVDVHGKRVMLLSKRDDPPHLYSVPLAELTELIQQTALSKQDESMASTPSSSASTARVRRDVTLKDEGVLTVIADQFKTPLLRSIFGVFATWATGMDAVYLPERALTRFVVLTYSYAFIFDQPNDVSINRAFSKPALRISLRNLPQAEAVLWDEKGEKITVFSEGFDTPVLQWSVPSVTE
ncbi:MAG: hypothetical protein P8176_04575 [Gammaproteobacteria bacterium]